MGFTYSPLRYPGGKSRLRRFIRDLIHTNDLTGGHYVEPFAGGAGLAWDLLIENLVGEVTLNDIDPAICAFWRSVFEFTDELCARVEDAPVTLDQWHRQKAIHSMQRNVTLIELGFATFFLNRTNRSGIISGGVIGGKAQRGSLKLDARFNKKDLVARIQRLAGFKDRVSVFQLDAIDFISSMTQSLPLKALIFIDPPYLGRGADLYMNPYSRSEHFRLAEVINTQIQQPWVVAYDNVEEVREMYGSSRLLAYDMSYSAHSRYVGSEVVVHPARLQSNAELLPVPRIN